MEARKERGPPRPGRLITVSTDYLSYHVNRYLLHSPGRTATEEGKGNEEEFSGWSVSSIREERRTTAGRGDEEGMDDSPIRGFSAVSSSSSRLKVYIAAAKAKIYIHICSDIYVHIYNKYIISPLYLFFLDTGGDRSRER
jgi:hypothetical protein